MDKREEIKARYKDPLHVSFDELTVKYNGKEMYMLSKRLLDNQMCWENLEEIKAMHWFKLLIYEIILETTDPVELKELAKDLTEIEFCLQELWKFTQDQRFHRFWEYPKCQCPKMDNEDSYPYQQIINMSCPLHGD